MKTVTFVDKNIRDSFFANETDSNNEHMPMPAPVLSPMPRLVQTPATASAPAPAPTRAQELKSMQLQSNIKAQMPTQAQSQAKAPFPFLAPMQSNAPSLVQAPAPTQAPTPTQAQSPTQTPAIMSSQPQAIKSASPLLNQSEDIDIDNSSTKKINVKHLIINTLLLIVIIYCVSLLFICPKSYRDYNMLILISLISGALYVTIELIFINYIDTMQSGGDNAYAYYSSDNNKSPYYSNKKTGGSYPYKYFDGQYPPKPSF